MNVDIFSYTTLIMSRQDGRRFPIAQFVLPTKIDLSPLSPDGFEVKARESPLNDTLNNYLNISFEDIPNASSDRDQPRLGSILQKQKQWDGDQFGQMQKSQHSAESRLTTKMKEETAIFKPTTFKSKDWEIINLSNMHWPKINSCTKL